MTIFNIEYIDHFRWKSDKNCLKLCDVCMTMPGFDEWLDGFQNIL